MERKVEADWGMVYLALCPPGEPGPLPRLSTRLSWRVDLGETGEGRWDWGEGEGSEHLLPCRDRAVAEGERGGGRGEWGGGR